MRQETLRRHTPLHYVLDYPWSTAWIAFAIVLTVVFKAAGV